MNSLSKYLVDAILAEEVNNVTVLLPGGFKPPHAGHLHLATSYADLPNVKEVLVLIGPKDRDGITRKTSIAIWKKLIESSKSSKIKVVSTSLDNPLSAAYEYLEKAKPGNYALAASTKGGDYIRVKNFTDQHQKGGKYHNKLAKGVTVSLLPIDPTPLKYTGRSDKEAGGISASKLRKDIQTRKKQDILTNYPGVDAKAQKDILDILLGKLKESMLVRFRLNEGGAAGHLAHPYEDLDLTFADIKNMIDTSLSGDLEFVQEKLDGQNLMITYKDGAVRAARNKTQIKDFGKNSLTVNQVAKMFSGRGPIEAAFTEAMKDLSSAINKLQPKEKEDFFQNGARFLSLEVLYPDTANVIPYGAAQLRLHHFKQYDENGNIVDEDTDGIVDLQTALDQTQATQQKTFQIKTTDLVKLKRDLDFDKQKKLFDGMVNDMKSTFKLKDADTVGTYNEMWWQNYINEAAKQVGYKISDDVMDSLVLRWANSDKSVRITKVLEMIPDQNFRQWVSDLDKGNLADQKKVALKPVETLFLKLGVRVLKNISNLVSVNPDESVRKIKLDLDNAVENIQSAIAAGKLTDKAKALGFLKTQLQRLQQIGGYDAIVPTEGIVFKYNGKLFKFTGAFAPINQIIGYLRF